MKSTVLHGYWRSSASYRLRIALALKGIDYDSTDVDLLSAENRSPDFLRLNPQGLVPALEIDDNCLSQSIAIIEYLDETRPGPRLLPGHALDRFRVRALSFAIAMEIHPICNTSVAKHVVDLTGGGEDARTAWMTHFISKGLRAFEDLLDHPSTGRFCHGDDPTMADCCLIPQLYNATRFGVAYDHLEKVVAISQACEALPAFRGANPDVIGPPGKAQTA